MSRLVVPDFISEPPLAGHLYGKEAARQWLKELAPEVREPAHWADDLKQSELVRRLAALQDVSEQRIETILAETNFRYFLRQRLVEFDPIPHEKEARRRFAQLARKTFRFRRRHRLAAPWGLFPASWSDDGIASLRREIPRCDRLIQEWIDWKSTWTALEARNPPLELRRRMSQVFDNNDFTSWNIGKERLFDDWLARGRRDPMPFMDTRNIVTEAFYRRLCDLRVLSNGWFYWRSDIGIVYVTRAEWEEISASWPGTLEEACASLEWP